MTDTQLSLIIHAVVAISFSALLALVLVILRGDPNFSAMLTGAMGLWGLIVGYFFRVAASG